MFCEPAQVSFGVCGFWIAYHHSIPQGTPEDVLWRGGLLRNGGLAVERGWGHLASGEGLSSWSLSIPGCFAQQHRQLELLNSFRERFGCDWLQYRSHLEAAGSPPLAATKTPALSSPPVDAQGLETASSPPATGGAEDTKESPQTVSEEEPEPHEEEREERDKEEGSREDLEEEEEQKEVEGEGPCDHWGYGDKWYWDVRRTVERPGWVEGFPWESRGSGPFFTLPRLSWPLCSGALSPHAGVSPARA